LLGQNSGAAAGVRSAAREAEDSATQGVERGEGWGYGLLREEAPSDGDVDASLSFTERTASSFEPEARIAACGTEAFSEIERNATHRTPHLRSEVAIATTDSLDQWPNQPNSLKGLIENFLSERGAHAPPRRSFRDTGNLRPFHPKQPVARKVRLPACAPRSDKKFEPQSALPAAAAAAAATCCCCYLLLLLPAAAAACCCCCLLLLLLLLPAAAAAACCCCCCLLLLLLLPAAAAAAACCCCLLLLLLLPAQPDLRLLIAAPNPRSSGLFSTIALPKNTATKLGAPTTACSAAPTPRSRNANATA
jgi:hypothetical protein